MKLIIRYRINQLKTPSVFTDLSTLKRIPGQKASFPGKFFPILPSGQNTALCERSGQIFTKLMLFAPKTRFAPRISILSQATILKLDKMTIKDAIDTAKSFFSHGVKHYLTKLAISPVIKDLNDDEVFSRLPESTVILEADYGATFGLESAKTLQAEIIR